MRLTITRAAGPGVEPTQETYDVPTFEGITVLDALSWIREHHDPSLAVRFSCRSANACRECIAVVDGQRTYTCTSRAEGDVTVEPLPNKDLLQDLVVDL